MKTFRQAMAEKVLVFDGACGTNLQQLNLAPAAYGGREGFNDWLAISSPQVLEGLHRSFLESGSDVVTTCTFGANRVKLAEYSAAHEVDRLNRAAVAVARRACDQAALKDGRPRFVAGDLGPTGQLPSAEDPELFRLSPAELEEVYFEQARSLAAAGVDALILETAQDIVELRCGVLAARRARQEAGRDLVIIAQATLDANGKMLLGTDIGAFMEALLRLGPDVIGLNCSTGPEEMKESVRFLCEKSPLPVSCQPNAGMPENLGQGRSRYPLTPEAMALSLGRFAREFGVDIVGGCCGTTPAHLKAVAGAMAGLAPGRRGHYPALEPAAASMLRRVPLNPGVPPLLVGERLNSQGSKRFREMLVKGEWDQIVALGREQAEAGAQVLDVSVAMAEGGVEKQNMLTAVKKLSLAVEAPLMIDSTEPEVIEAALGACPGRPLVNSINLEGDGSRLRRVAPLVKRYGAGVVALCIDGPGEARQGDGVERGMAKTAARKLQVARRLRDICVGEYGLDPSDLLIDPLTFSLATGQAEYAHSALETLEGLRLIKKELPGVLTLLGVSNVSFGIKPAPRAAVNSVFLHHAVLAGLDVCIINPKDIQPYTQMDPEARRLAEDLVFDRSAGALADLVEYFESRGGKAPVAEAAPMEKLSAEDRLRRNLLHRVKDGLAEALEEALTRHTPVEIINQILLPGMKEVGDKFGSGELILPFVLQSVEVMKAALNLLEKRLDKKDLTTRGTMVLATVQGDVHDIGKNLVRTILSNNGFTVHDLGKQVPVNTIVEEARRLRADFVGLSALLVSTSRQMPLVVQELRRVGLRIPVLLGGAAINPSFTRQSGLVDGRPYEGGVFYARDAFEGLEICNRLTDPDLAVRSRILEENLKGIQAESKVVHVSPEPNKTVSGSPLLPAEKLPKPPFTGAKALHGHDIPLKEVLGLLDEAQLFRLNWGVKAATPAEYEALIAKEFRPKLEQLKQECLAKGWLQPRAVYGFWPAHSIREDLAILDPSGGREIGRFSFQRAVSDPRLCLADFVERQEGRPGDHAAFFVATMGAAAQEKEAHLNGRGKFSEALFLHGLAVQAAEALAEWLHRRMRREWGLGAEQGLRFSPGYPAWRNLEDQKMIFRLLEPEAAIHVSLTQGLQMVPEASVSAAVFHHPGAAYFATSPLTPS